MLTVDDYAALPTLPADHRIAYGDDPQQFVDLYLPQAGEQHPVVVLIHGGCWRNRFGLEPLGQMARALNAHGPAVWSLEYRRLGSGGGWPATFQDVAQAADALRANAQTFSLDLARVVAVGHSAGGHLALWLAVRGRLPADSLLYTDDPLPLKGVVSLAGIPDLITAVQRKICNGAPAELVGSAPSVVPLRYAQASPHAHYPLGVPHIHLVGDQDPVIPLEYAQQTVRQAQDAGDSCRLEILPGMGHFELVTAGSPVWPQVEEAIRELIE